MSRLPIPGYAAPFLPKAWALVRPFTLLIPAVGMTSGSLIALGSAPRWQSDWSDTSGGILWHIALGALMAAILNGASNAINQIFDVEVDRINKPERPLPSGRMTVREAWAVALFCFALAWSLALAINIVCFFLAVAASILTTIYSAPPLRVKRNGFWANITIAIPRGTLLCVAGWSTVKSVGYLEPWWIGSIYGLYFLGAATTKDFSDIEGDRRTGCRTLPVIYGVRKASYLIAPFFVLPFLLIHVGVGAGILTGNRLALGVLGTVLPLWGAYLAYSMLRQPVLLHERENSVWWKQMVLFTLSAQVGFALSYLL